MVFSILWYLFWLVVQIRHLWNLFLQHSTFGAKCGLNLGRQYSRIFVFQWILNLNWRSKFIRCAYTLVPCMTLDYFHFLSTIILGVGMVRVHYIKFTFQIVFWTTPPVCSVASNIIHGILDTPGLNIFKVLHITIVGVLSSSIGLFIGHWVISICIQPLYILIELL